MKEPQLGHERRLIDWHIAKRAAAAIALALFLDASHAGPPLVTDDTGTADKGTWEFTVFAEGEFRESVDSAITPAVDVAYGITSSLQASLVIPRQVVRTEPYENMPSTRQTGWGEANASLKWRFLESNNRALAVAPSISFPLSKSSRLRGLIDDTYLVSLPLLGSISRGPWELGGQIGYAWSTELPDAITYGATFGRDVSESLTLKGEVWGVEFKGSGASGGVSNWRAGIEWSLPKRLVLLAAYGGPLSSSLEPEEQLDWDYYIGLRYVAKPDRRR